MNRGRIMPDGGEVPQRRKCSRGCQTSLPDSFEVCGHPRYLSRAMAGSWIRLTSNAAIDPADLIWRVSRSGGPGGQHANTSDTRVEVILDLRHCTSLSAWQRSQLTARLGPVVRAVAADSRSQSRNREVALDRLVHKLRAGLRVDPPRRATKPTRGAREDRLRSKQRRSDIKRGRARPHTDDEG